MARKIEIPGSGIFAGVRMGDSFLDIDDDGYVGQLPRGTAIIDVWVGADSDDTTYGVYVDGEKNMAYKSNLALPGRGKHYTQRVDIKEYGTRYSGNNLRVLRLGSKGKLLIQEFTLVKQGEDFFFVTQETERARFYRDDEKLVCPGSRYDGRPQSLDFFAELLGEGVRDLASVMEYQEQPDIDIQGMAPKTGKVLFYTRSMGSGGMVTPEGWARVRWNNINRDGRFAYLTEGDEVSYEELQASNQRQKQTGDLKQLATMYRAAQLRETSFEYEAVGVTPI